MPDNVAKLIISGQVEAAEQEILLIDDVITLGRSASCQIVLGPNFASRRRAQITRREEL